MVAAFKSTHVPILTEDQHSIWKRGKLWLLLLAFPLVLFGCALWPLVAPVRVRLPGNRVLTMVTHRDISETVTIVSGDAGSVALVPEARPGWSSGAVLRSRVWTLRVGSWANVLTLRPASQPHMVFLGNASSSDYMLLGDEFPGGR